VQHLTSSNAAMQHALYITTKNEWLIGWLEFIVSLFSTNTAISETRNEWSCCSLCQVAAMAKNLCCLLNAYQHEDDRIHKVIIRDQPNSRKNVLFHNGFLKIRPISWKLRVCQFMDISHALLSLFKGVISL